ncbi:MAG: sulfite oxidase heme-binding subunit YedZ [Hyphomicrobiales bacterium]
MANKWHRFIPAWILRNFIDPMSATASNSLFKSTRSFIGVIKPLLFCFMLLPSLLIIYAIFFDPLMLGANPAEAILHHTGDWVIYSLLLTLAVTPVRRVTKWNDAIKLRRMLGLFSFYYVSLHFLAYLGFDRLFDLSDMAREIAKRPFILVGFLAFLLMIPLAVTSTRGWVLRIGGKTWAQLHKLIYAIAILGIIHYWWLVKRDIFWPLLLGLVLTALLAYRLISALPKAPRHRGVRAAS